MHNAEPGARFIGHSQILPHQPWLSQPWYPDQAHVFPAIMCPYLGLSLPPNLPPPLLFWAIPLFWSFKGDVNCFTPKLHLRSTFDIRSVCLSSGTEKFGIFPQMRKHSNSWPQLLSHNCLIPVTNDLFLWVVISCHSMGYPQPSCNAVFWLFGFSKSPKLKMNLHIQI